MLRRGGHHFLDCAVQVRSREVRVLIRRGAERVHPGRGRSREAQAELVMSIGAFWQLARVLHMYQLVELALGTGRPERQVFFTISPRKLAAPEHVPANLFVLILENFAISL